MLILDYIQLSFYNIRWSGFVLTGFERRLEG
jgi:hypothetical protein